jgi:hypothetical protein
MQQRQPRLGDIVDDYCPRERRITNHAIVAMVGDEVKQTRCTTCESDHEYKQAKVPPQRRKKEVTGALYQQVLSGMPRKVAASAVADAPDDQPADTELPDSAPLMADSESELPEPEPAAEPVAAAARVTDDAEGPVHRPLIRATLPRLTDEPPQRREPDFTVRNVHNRPGKFGKNGFRGPRPGGQGFQGDGNRAPNGNRAGHGQRAAGGKRHGHGGGRPGGGRPSHAPQGNRPPHQGGRGRGGKKSPR